MQSDLGSYIVQKATNTQKISRFDNFFKTATTHQPYAYQRSIATSDIIPDLIEIPTGLGKTDAIILGWLWRRLFDPDEEIRSKTPRRLVYCLPMRVLVEQTKLKVEGWLKNLGMLAENPGDTKPLDGFAQEHAKENGRIAVTVLMGGEEREWWDLYPERDAIIIGTQDMLLSRALNRGYGMSKFRWPTHFGLLNNDCLWVMDEIQLMGRGLATTTQLQAFRKKLGTLDSLPTRSVWMSATLDPDWLHTVDFDPKKEIATHISLTEEDASQQPVQKRTNAVKNLYAVESDSSESNPIEQKKLAEYIQKAHKNESRTLVVVNTIGRAVKLYQELIKLKPSAKCVLIHSHFRPPDRKQRIDELLENPKAEGTIIISTQVVEAGVDISAKTLFTELAPWSSLVQRFGRCNRLGEYDDAEVHWIDIPTEKKGSALPYTEDELDLSREMLTNLEGMSVSPSNLPEVPQPVIHQHVIRKKDLVELFDTTPDLAGSDTDVSRFIRETTDTDVQVFWRTIDNNNPQKEPLPHRDELCSVPVGDIQNMVNKNAVVWRWDSLDEQWVRIQAKTRIFPGMTLMLHSKDGRYTDTEGWSIQSKKAVIPITVKHDAVDVSHSGNEMAVGAWRSISHHTDMVTKEMKCITDSVQLDDYLSETLFEAVRWHDSGKAHPSFQAMIKEDKLAHFPDQPVAKAPKDAWKKWGKATGNGNTMQRAYFRHELASGILALQHGRGDLVAYLAAAHHGKVRGSIRSMPDEQKPPDQMIRFARGVWDGDIIEEVSLGGGVIVPRTELDLSYMELGDGSRGPSWSARVLGLRDHVDLGPFRLAYLEAIVKGADERASRGDQ